MQKYTLTNRYQNSKIILKRENILLPTESSIPKNYEFAYSWFP